jgi:hypothetical protein
MQDAVWSIVVHFLFHFGKSIKAGLANQNEEHPQMKTYPTTEEPRPGFPLTSDDHRTGSKVPQNINIVDDVNVLLHCVNIHNSNCNADTESITLRYIKIYNLLRIKI